MCFPPYYEHNLSPPCEAKLSCTVLFPPDAVLPLRVPKGLPCKRVSHALFLLSELPFSCSRSAKRVVPFPLPSLSSSHESGSHARARHATKTLSTPSLTPPPLPSPLPPLPLPPPPPPPAKGFLVPQQTGRLPGATPKTCRRTLVARPADQGQG